MKGVTVDKPGAAWILVEDIQVPEPSEGQILVKSISTAINPVEVYMQATGLLVTAWPIVLGCDASGIVLKAGSKTKYKPGDRVCGCTRLGVPGHSTFQESFLMDDEHVIPIPSSLSFNEAAAVGVGTETACLGLFQGIGLERDSTQKTTWVVIFGGAGSVGQYSLQIAKMLGYKIVTTCSNRTADLVRSLGADSVIDYSISDDEQLAELKKVTEGNFFAVWDTVGKGEKLGRRALQEISTHKEGKTYATTDDWTPMEKYDDHATYRVELGMIGRDKEEAKAAGASPQLNEDLTDYCKFVAGLLEEGKLKVSPLQIVSGGFETLPKAIDIQQKGTKGGEKVVVELQSP